MNVSERSLALGNNILRNVTSSGWSNLNVNPLMIGISILAYLIFAFWYMTIVRDIEEMWAPLPWHFVLAVYLLTLLGILLAFAAYYTITIRLYMHSEREREFRSLLLDYFSVKCSEKNIDPDALRSAKKKDEDISATEQPDRKWKLLLLLPVCLLILFLTMFVEVAHTHLGEVTLILMLFVFAVLILLSPDVTRFVYGHEARYKDFFEDIVEIEGIFGMEPISFDSTLVEHDSVKMKKYTLCTLGVYSIYWGYVLYKDIDRHFLAHKHTEIAIMNDIWYLETGELPNINL